MEIEYAPVLAGVLLLLLGKRLFWLYVGAVGFVSGLNAVQSLMPDAAQDIQLGAAAVAAVIGILLAIFFQKFAVSGAGFLAGGTIAYMICGQLGWLSPDQIWIAFPVGGIIGGMLALWLFDVAMILLSSVMGALLVTQPVVDRSWWLLAAAGFALFGVLFQSGFVTRKRKAA